MDVATRLEINALIDRLVADGNTFDRADGQRLIKLVPIGKDPAKISVVLSSIFPGRRLEGHTTTGRAASVEGDQEERSASFGEGEHFRAGRYKLSHSVGEIEIEQPFNDTLADAGDEKAALLRYDPKTREPLVLDIRKSVPWGLGPFVLVFARYVPWKRPV